MKIRCEPDSPGDNRLGKLASERNMNCWCRRPDTAVLLPSTGCEKNVGVVESDLTHALAGRKVPSSRSVDPTRRRHHVLIASRVSSDPIEARRLGSSPSQSCPLTRKAINTPTLGESNDEINTLRWHTSRDHRRRYP